MTPLVPTPPWADETTGIQARPTEVQSLSPRSSGAGTVVVGEFRTERAFRMATILIVEDAPDVAPRAAPVLAAHGHQVFRCSGGLSPSSACPLLRGSHCTLADGADLIVFACVQSIPVAGRSYRGEHLLAAYRAHDLYGRLPMLIVGVLPPGSRVGGAGPVEFADTTASADEIADAADRLLERATASRRRPVRAGFPHRRQAAVQASRRRTG